MTIQNERRKKERISALFITTSLEKINEDKTFLTRSEDISEKGIKVISDKELSPGDDLTIILLLQGYRDTLKIPGKVVWSHSSRRSLESCEAGIKFTALSNLQQKLLSDYIRHHGHHDLKTTPV